MLNILLISIITTLYAIWLKHYQQSENWALSLLLIPSFWLVLSISTSDLLSVCLSLATLLCYRKNKIFLTILCASLAILTREPTALLLVALFIAAIIEKKYIFLRYLWIPLVPFIAWSYYLSLIIDNGSQVFLISNEIGYPLFGIFKKLIMLISPDKISPEYLFDVSAFSLLTLVVSTGAKSAWGNLRLYPELSTIYFLQLLLISTLTFHVVARFPDYTRVSVDIYLFSFMMLPWSGRFYRRLIPSLAALVSIGYIIGFILERA